MNTQLHCRMWESGRCRGGEVESHDAFLSRGFHVLRVRLEIVVMERPCRWLLKHGERVTCFEIHVV